tara:strand:+ start:1050 stop:1631 length:582 start_codon:yes stop_codon:yes gene_type:complete
MRFYASPIILTVSLAAAAPAFAQDSDVEAFTGARAEVTVGLDQLRFNLADVGGDADARGKQNDLGYGVTLGYDYAVSPSVIVGVEGSANFADTSYTTDTGSLRARRDLSIAGRVGTPITSNSLLYGKLGYSNFQLTQDSGSGASRETHDGVLMGAGVEVKMTPDIYWKSEYNHTDYSDGLISNDITTGIGIRF